MRRPLSPSNSPLQATQKSKIYRKEFKTEHIKAKHYSYTRTFQGTQKGGIYRKRFKAEHIKAKHYSYTRTFQGTQKTESTEKDSRQNI